MSAQERSLEEIGRRIIYLEVRARSRMAEWMEQIAEFDRRGGAHRDGFRTTAEWLAHACGLDGRTARDHVRVARRLEQLPKVAEAFGDGRLSYAQVRALSRADESEPEADLLRVALVSTASELERYVRQLRSAVSADLDVANRGRAKRFVKHFWEDDGSLRFFGRLAADDGAALVEAVDSEAAKLTGEGLGARRADALVELVTGGGVQTHVVLHADPTALACSARGDEQRAGEVLHLRGGPAIPSQVARRLTCDAMVSVKGLNLGRTTRVISRAQRRALEARDGHVCAMPGCERTHGLDGHHVVHWAQGGRTDLDNLVLLCRYHHRLFHDDGFSLRRGRGGVLVIRDPAGRELHRLPSRASPLRAAA